MRSEEITGFYDCNAEVAVSGQTAHLLRMADSASAKRFVFYRRSLDGGQTWQGRKKIFSTYFSDIVDDREQERLAVEGNSANILINGYTRGKLWAGKMTCFRSIDNGATFEAPRVLFLAELAHHVVNRRIRAEGKRLLIPFRVQTNWLVNNSGRLLIFDDRGNTLQER